MKKNFLRTAVVAGLCLFAAVAALAPQAYADDKPKAPTISASISKQVVAAQKALQAKDWAGALAALKGLDQTSNLTDYDKYVINYFTGFAELRSNDTADAKVAFEAAAVSPAAPVDQRSDAIRIALQLEDDASNWSKVIELAKLAADDNISDPSIPGVAAIAYVKQNDYVNAEINAQKSIDLSKAAGKQPEHSAYQVLLICANQKHDMATETKIFEQLVNHYGEPADWGNLVGIAMASIQAINPANPANRELTALYLFRLDVVTKGQMNEEDMSLGTDVALKANSPGDALAIVHAGLDEGIITPDKAGPLLAAANARGRGEEAVLGTAEKAAAKAASGNEAVSVGETYYGYGHYADAERVAKLALAKGGPKSVEAQFLIGIAQAAQDKDDEAAQSLALVKGDSTLERAAYLWTLYASRTYGKTAAAAPAAH